MIIISNSSGENQRIKAHKIFGFVLFFNFEFLSVLLTATLTVNYAESPVTNVMNLHTQWSRLPYRYNTTI